MKSLLYEIKNPGTTAGPKGRCTQGQTLSSDSIMCLHGLRECSFFTTLMLPRTVHGTEQVLVNIY